MHTKNYGGNEKSDFMYVKKKAVRVVTIAT